MNMDKKVTNTILACTIVMSLVGISHMVFADDTTQAMEKCYGIAKAGQNDCDTSGSTTCDKSVIDADPNYFVYVPKGACNKIVGGMTIMGGTPKSATPTTTTTTTTTPATTTTPDTTTTTTTTPATPTMPATPSMPATPPASTGSTGTGY